MRTQKQRKSVNELIKETDKKIVILLRERDKEENPILKQYIFQKITQEVKIFLQILQLKEYEEKAVNRIIEANGWDKYLMGEK